MCTCALPRSSSSIISATFLPDGDRVISASQDGVIRVWKLDALKVEREFKQSEALTAFACSSDGRRAVSGTYNDSVLIWDLGSDDRVGTRRCLRYPNDSKDIATEYPPIVGPVTSLAFLTDGDGIACGIGDLTLELHGDDTKLLVVSAGSASVSIMPVSSGESVLLGFGDGTICVYDMETGTSKTGKLAGQSSGISVVAISSRGHIVSGVTDTGMINVWRTTEMGLEVVKNIPPGNQAKVKSFAFSPDGKHLVSAGDKRTCPL